MHLLLASQRLEEGRLRGLESHLSYRIGLRTFSAGESRTVLGVPDAYELPPVPGLATSSPTSHPDQVQGRLRVGSAQAGAGAGPPTPTGPRPRPRSCRSPWRRSLPARRGRPPAPRRAPGAGSRRRRGRSSTSLVARMKGQGRPAHQVWLPPLDVPTSMDQLLGDLAPHPGPAACSTRWRERGSYVLPVGIVDQPLEQRRELLRAAARRRRRARGGRRRPALGQARRCCAPSSARSR